MSKELLRTRIGNTVTVVLPVLTRGDAVSLVGRDITIMLVDPNDTKTPVSFTIGGVDNNIATFVVEGTSQTATGTYRAEVYENYRGTAMAVYDCDIFVLVARTEYENDGNEGVSSETTTLDPINIAWVGRDGYTPYIQDGYWYINGTSTNVKAAGENGDTPYIENGCWYIGGISTGIKVDYTNEEAERSAAEQVRVVTEAARVQAEAARTLAENSRLSEESGRSAAEGVRILAERDRQSEEAMRQTQEEIRHDNEEARVEAELGRAASEASRAQVEASRVANENARTTAEATRAANEQTRVAEETDRAAAETARIAAETAREGAEDGRTSAEATRVSNEQTRVSNEGTRQSNESARQAAETARQSAYTAAENARDAAFAAKEATRDAANQAALNCADTLAALGQQLDGVKDRVAATETAIRDLQELFGESVEGYVRVAETSDPKMEFREYKHTKVGEESVFDCYKPCLVGNNFTGEGTCGKILHILNPLDWYKDENGNAVVLDGSMGEVLICNTETLYAIVGHVSVDNVDYDVFLYSRIPFEWNGHRAEELPPTGLSPHYCVSHTDSDNVTRMHSVLNMEWDGSYQAQVDCVGKFVATDDGEGNIVETYDADAKIIGDAKGKSSTGISLPNGEQYAMNINDDNTKTIPYFNSHVDAVEKHHVGLMFAESGTFYLHAATKMGSGFCTNVQATTAARWAEDNSEASNGFRYIKHDGTTWGYYPLSSNANFGLGTTGDSLYKACMLNLWRSPWNIFEQQRVLMYAVANHIEELTWFAFEGNIYKYRSVDGLKGLADGVMTGVVWKKLASKLKDGAVEPSTENAVGGNRCEWLISSAVYRGVITDVSPSWWTSGLWMTQWGTDNRHEGWLCRDQSKMLKSSNSNTIDDSTLLPQEQSDDYIKLPTLTYGNGYRKNYAQTLFWSDRIASMSGASIGTYIGAYAFLNGTRPAEGKKVARGCRRGANAYYAYLSPLFVYGYSAPSYANAVAAFGICCRIES